MTHLIISKIRTLIAFLLLRALEALVSVPDRRYKQGPYSKPYQPIRIDPPAIVGNVDKKIIPHYREILKRAKAGGHKIEPVKHRKDIPKNLRCKYCHAPSGFLYSNGNAPRYKDGHPLFDSSGRPILTRQFQCKLCGSTLREYQERKNAFFFCPFCLKPLVFVKKRKDFIIHKCINKKCPYRLNRIKELSEKNEPLSQRKLSYTYREFLFRVNELKGNTIENERVNFSRIHFPVSIVSLALSFYINLGLSSREVACALYGLFKVSVSHQTVINWLNSAAHLLKPFFDDYKIECSDSLVGDETYIKIKEFWGYVFLIYDFGKSRILSMYLSLKRDTRAASNAIYEAIRKTSNGFSKFITDGNPIYQLAHQFFILKEISFYQHFIVRGLKNMDETSALYRNFRQAVERVIRTYKQRYNRTHGFKSMDGAVVFNVLFGIYFNFMRPHEALGNQVPIQLPELKDASYQEAWAVLIGKAISCYRDSKT